MILLKILDTEHNWAYHPELVGAILPKEKTPRNIDAVEIYLDPEKKSLSLMNEGS